MVIIKCRKEKKRKEKKKTNFFFPTIYVTLFYFVKNISNKLNALPTKFCGTSHLTLEIETIKLFGDRTIRLWQKYWQ
jgi:hypothetical protein